jgi:hypothetical protein
MVSCLTVSLSGCCHRDIGNMLPDGLSGRHEVRNAMTRFRILLARTICPAMLGLVVSSGIASGAQAEAPDVKPSANAMPIRAEQDLPLPVELSDVRTYRHCHNTPRRTYCHTKERLPIRVPAAKVTTAPGLSHVS